MSDPAQLVVTLRQWAADAQTFTDATHWVGSTYTVAKDTTLKTTVQRLGVLADNLADVLSHHAETNL